MPNQEELFSLNLKVNTYSSLNTKGQLSWHSMALQRLTYRIFVLMDLMLLDEVDRHMVQGSILLLVLTFHWDTVKAVKKCY